MLVNIERLERTIYRVEFVDCLRMFLRGVGPDPFTRSEDQGWQRMKSIAEVSAATQDALIQFLHADLAVCETFAAVVETELGLDEQGALEAFNRAVRACETIQELVQRVQDATKRLEIEEILNLLKARLAGLEAVMRSDCHFYRSI